jgi:hypothetical protein
MCIVPSYQEEQAKLSARMARFGVAPTPKVEMEKRIMKFGNPFDRYVALDERCFSAHIFWLFGFKREVPSKQVSNDK